MTYGLTSEGFNRKRLPDIKGELEAAVKASFGAVDVSAGSVFGQLIGAIADRLSSLWLRSEEIYNALYPATAENSALDGVCQLLGIYRLAAARSTVMGALKGDEGTIVPQSSLVKLDGSTDNFRTLANVEITREHVIQITVAPDAAINGRTYEIDINGVTYEATGGVTPTLEQIVDDLIADMGTIDGITITDNGESLTLTATDYTTAFSVNADFAHTYHTVVSDIESPASFEAVETGYVPVPIDTLTEIQTPVSGWDSVTNYIEGIPGRAVETDSELRLRRAESLSVIGAGTCEAMRARILQGVDGVSAVTVYENDTDGVVDSRPAHSLEVIVVGGDDDAVAAKIWEVKPCGIATYGTTSVMVDDSQGNPHQIKFSRPSSIEIWVEVETVHSSEETFPANGNNSIKAAVLALGETLAVGQDVIVQKFFAAVYSVPGISEATIRVRAGSAPGGSGYTSNIAIASTEAATFDIDHIAVTP